MAYGRAMVKVLSAKLDEELIERLGVAADARGITRNALVREALEAAVDGRVRHLTKEEQQARRLQTLRDGLAWDRQRLKEALGRRAARSQ